MRTFLLTTVLGIAVFGFAEAGKVKANWPRGSCTICSNGGQNCIPQWHRTSTLYGAVPVSSNGLHGYLAPTYTVSPWGGIQGYSLTPFGLARSYNGFLSTSPYAGPYYYRGFYGNGYYGAAYYGGGYSRGYPSYYYSYSPYSYSYYSPYSGGYYRRFGW